MSPEKLFKCLSDETRLRLVQIIHLEGELCVCDLTTALAQSQSKISRHLAQLRNCGILNDRRRGQWVFYSLHPELPPWALQVVAIACDAQGPDLGPPLGRLQAIPDRQSCR